MTIRVQFTLETPQLSDFYSKLFRIQNGGFGGGVGFNKIIHISRSECVGI